MNVIRTTKQKLAYITAQRISDILESLVEEDVLLLLAGGSSFEVYDSIRPLGLHSRLTIAMTDDRFSHEMDVNNFHQLQATHFYNEAVRNDVYVISTEVWNEEKPEELAERFEKGLRGWRAEFPKGKVVAIFGVGIDGHTAGMIPNPDSKIFKEKFQNKKTWVVGFTTPHNQYHERITVTMPFIQEHIDFAIVYVAGEKKRQALAHVLEIDGVLNKTPVRIIRELKNVDLFTDISP